MAANGEMRDRRQAIVDEHVEAENAGDLDRALKTFHAHPHYVMLGTELDGEEAVRTALTALFTSFANFNYHITKTHHADEAVILLGYFTATHSGSYMGIAPRGRQISVPGVAIFDFEKDRLLNETVFFDTNFLLRQLRDDGSAEMFGSG